jgi:hypothetical protein
MLLDELRTKILSPEGIALLERKVREHARSPKPAPKREAVQVTRKAAEIEHLRSLMKVGTLSQAVARAAIEKAEEELGALEPVQPAKEEKHLARIIRMLPRATDVLRERIGAGNVGLRDPSSIVQGRNLLFSMLGGKVPLRPGTPKPARGRTRSAALDLTAECCFRPRRVPPVVSKVVAGARFANFRRRRALRRAA